MPEPTINGNNVNLHKHYNLNNSFILKDISINNIEWLKKELNKCDVTKQTLPKLIQLSDKIYEKGYCGIDIINLLEKHTFLNIADDKRYEYLIAFNRVRKEFRNEKILILFILQFLFLDKTYVLENISFI